MQVKNTLAFACACALIALLGASALRADTGSEPPATTTTTDAAPALGLELTAGERQRLDYYRHQVWQWQRIMGIPVTRVLPNAPREFAKKLSAWSRFTTSIRRR